MNRKEEIKRRVQIMIDEFDMSPSEIYALNDDYNFNYSGDNKEDEEKDKDYCPDCGEYIDNCECDNDEDEDTPTPNSCGSDFTFHFAHLAPVPANPDQTAADEFAQHEFNEFKKKNNPGSGSTPQKGL